MGVAGGLCVRHVAVSDGSHGHHRPPERIGDRLEQRGFRARLGEVHSAREQNDTCNTATGRSQYLMSP